MPLIKPEIETVLKEVFGSSTKNEDEDPKPQELSQKLEKAGLGLKTTLDTVGWLMENGASDAIRLRAAEDSLKVHGLMKEQPAAAPIVNIVINDPGAAQMEINPILIPREVLLH